MNFFQMKVTSYYSLGQINMLSWPWIFSTEDPKAMYFLTVNLKQLVYGLLTPNPIVKRLLASYTVIFVHKISRGFKCPTPPPNLGSQKLAKTTGLWVGLWYPNVNFQRVCCKGPFGNRFRASRSKLDFEMWRLKPKWPEPLTWKICL